MSTPHRRSLVLAAAALAGLALATSLALVTPAGAKDLQRDLQEVRRQATQPRKSVKLPTRPSQRLHKVRPDRAKARTGRGHADRVRARPGRYHPEPRVRDDRDRLRHRHGG